MDCHHFGIKPSAATVPFSVLFNPLEQGVVGVTAVIAACARGRRDDDPGRDQWSHGGHPDYLLGFDAEVIDSGLPGCPGCLRELLWLSVLTDTLNNVSIMSWQWFIPTKALCILCCTFLNLYGHLHRFCHWLSIWYCHSCHVIVPWCVYLFGPKWSINYYYYWHYSEVIMGPMASPITSLTLVYSTVYSGTDQRKHQSSMSLAFVRGIHRWPANSPHKGPVTRKMFPFDDVIMIRNKCHTLMFLF